MDFLGIGPLELLFILLLVLLVFGPRDIAKATRSFGYFLNRLYKSENYRVLQKTSEEIRNLPNLLAREAQLEELKQAEQELKEAGQSIAPAQKPFPAWTQELPEASAPPSLQQPPAPQEPPAA
jgi:Sec-independent protein translocase protein TatA